MPAYSPGLSFQPGATATGQGQSRETPLQSAVKLLSLRLPTVVGARSPIPQALIGGSGMGPQGLGAYGAGSLEALIAQLMQAANGGQGGQGPGPGPGAPNIPAPIFKPGGGGGGTETEPPPTQTPPGGGGGPNQPENQQAFGFAPNGRDALYQVLGGMPQMRPGVR